MIQKNFSNLLIALVALLLISCSSTTDNTKNLGYDWYNLDTVKAQKFDTGRMWTFEDAPLDYFEETYDFRPSEDWIEHVKLSALKLANWCSASFVSEDGLIMTNHHCVDFITSRFEEEGEDIAANGFYAETLEEERKISNLFVDQLVFIADVTGEVNNAVDAAAAGSKSEAKNTKIKELQKKYSDETGLICKVTELYNGGKYSLYGYKRYKDIRAVFVLETDMGLYGGDPDNFTYPRYNPDFAFLRAYDEDGKPLKVQNYFKWSKDGPQPEEPIFVVGNPGKTERLKTVSQLEYERDFSYKFQSAIANGYVDILVDLMNKNDENFEKYKAGINYIANSAKVYKGILDGLRDPVFMARKKDFEKAFKYKVQSNPELNKKYGYIWDALTELQKEKFQISPEFNGYRINRIYFASQFLIAKKLIDIAEQLQLPDEQRKTDYQQENIENTVASIFDDEIDKDLDFRKLALNADYLRELIGETEEYKNLFNGFIGMRAAEYALSKTIMNDKDAVQALVQKGADAILNSDDPFIRYAIKAEKRVSELQPRYREINQAEEDLEYQLGRALFEVYGTSIPPDATFTLRINDGEMKSYSYNGTVAPLFTTFYGMYDRYYSHQKKYPWDLPERWQNPGPEFDLETPYNFISTNDITGGSSGSPVINKDAEIIGIAFDGNIQSLPGSFIYSTEANRMVSVASTGILEIVDDLLNADRLAEEIKNGKIVSE